MYLRILLQAMASLALLAATYSSLLAPQQFHGHAMSTSDKFLCMLIAGQEVLVTLAPDASVTIDGQPANIRDVKSHHYLTIVCDRKGDTWLARKVTATVQPTWLHANTACGLVWYEQRASTVDLMGAE